MALPAAIASMITITSTAAGILGIIKRRCGASQTITDLVTKCDELLKKIRKLLKSLETSTKVPHDAREISTALNLRREEFDEILKKFHRMSRRTKRTHHVDRTEKFIMAQGWGNKLGAIHNDLVELRNGVETIVSSWGVGQFVIKKVQEIVTADMTKQEGSGEHSRRRYPNESSKVTGLETLNYVERLHIAMVKLTDENKSVLNRYGDLDELSLPDALFQAYEHGHNLSEICRIQLLQRSAELLHPCANSMMGLNYKSGDEGMEKNLDLAVSHFRVATSRGDTFSGILLMEYYHLGNDQKKALKYFETTTNMDLDLISWIQCVQFAIEHSFDTTLLLQTLHRASEDECAMQQSICHFLGLGMPKSYQKSIDALPTFDSNYYSLAMNGEDMSKFCVIGELLRWPICDFFDFNESYRTLARSYADFLFKANQFLPFLFSSYGWGTYSWRKWRDYAFHAASSNCVDAHIFLALHYQRRTHENEREMQRHLRIAADEGNSQAQHIYRRIFGAKESAFRTVRLLEEPRDDNQEKQRRTKSTKTSKNTGKEPAKKHCDRRSRKNEIFSS